MAVVGPRRLREEDIKGVVFDVDGTLLDSMAWFYPSWERTGAMPEFDLEVNEDDFYRCAGMPLADIVQDVYTLKKGKPATQEFVEAFLKEKIRQHQLDEEANGRPKPIDDVVAIAKQYKERGIPIAIATSGRKEIVLDHLEHAGLADLVDAQHTVYASDVPKGKPDPAIYVEAARRIGVDPQFCRAYEDAETGLQSAYMAGMEVIDVTFMDGYPAPPALRRAKAAQEKARTWC